MQDPKGIRQIDDLADSHFPIIGHGLRNRSNFFSDFFDKDPFDDPFFSRPFGSLFPSMGEVFEPFPYRQSSRTLDKRLQEQQGSRSVVIEELPGDHEDAVAVKTKSHQEPIVEHPDDSALQRDNSNIFLQTEILFLDAHFSILCYSDKLHAILMLLAVHNRGRSRSYTQSFAFSSVTYGGPHGTYYKSSAMRRTGADGLFEEIREEKDSLKGHETNQIVHGLGDKGHAVTRKKSATGKEDYVETLHNITEEEKKDFDETWKKLAKKYLPGFGKGLGMLLKSNNAEPEESEAGGSSSSVKQLPWSWPWAKKA